MITLVFKLVKYSLFKFKVPPNFNNGLSLKLKIKTRLWYACLICFIGELQNFVDFSPTLKQQKEIIFHITRIAILVEKEFDSSSSILTSKNFRNVILEKITNQDAALLKVAQQVSPSIRRIKELVPNNSCYNNFQENIIKTWETHGVRDVKECNTNVSKDRATKCSEERGGLYFLALVFALSPENLTETYQRAVYFCGAWFQITDDYSDREKDFSVKNTPFTVGTNEPLKKIFAKKIFEGWKTNNKNHIETSVDNQGKLIKFMERLCTLLLLSPF